MDSPTSMRSPLPRLTPNIIREIFYRLGQVFAHVEYAVCGTAAMVAYGFTGRCPAHVSIVCPAFTKEVVLSWAAAGGLKTYPSDSNAIGVHVTSGEWFKVRTKYLATDDNHRFDRLETVGLRVGDDRVVTQVLTMPALVNQLAMAYVDERWAADWGYRTLLAGDILWLLRRICEDGSGLHGLKGASIPAVRKPAFWLVLTTASPEAAGLFYDAGFRPYEVDDKDEDMLMECSSDAQPRVDTSMSSRIDNRPWPHQLVIEPPTSNRRGAVSRQRSGSRPSARSGDGPVLTRAEERAVMMDTSSLPRGNAACSLDDALEKLFIGGPR